MKKFFILGLIVIIGGLCFGGILPGLFNQNECVKFHPHADDFGGSANVVRILDWITGGSMKFNAWTNGTKTVVQFVFNKSTGFITYGTGNPTMFTPENGQTYVDQNVSGPTWKKITSNEGLKKVQTDLQCHKAAYNAALAAAAAAPAAQAPTLPPPTTANIMPLIATVGFCLLMLVVFAGAKALAR